VPAHFSGIAGLKPTPGRVSAAGHFPVIEHPGGLLGVAGPMARSALDVQALFAALAGYDFKDPFSAPVPLRKPDVENLRIGIWPQFYDVPVQPSIRAALDDAARTLETIGIRAAPFQPAGLERAPNAWWFFFGQLPAPFTQKVIAGREGDAHWTSTEFLKTALDQPAPTAEQVVANLAIRDRMRTDLLGQMEQYPVLLTPPCGVTAFPHRSRKWSAGDNSIGLFQAMMPSTYVNLLGLPAMAIPFGVSEEGLPVGIQLVGRPYEEELLLDIAVRLEKARGPFPGPPGY
ncbi:MAG: amidase, partial [Acidobacteriota bacterium]|nr:amidase [Acidobacteriota bacterium]